MLKDDIADHEKARAQEYIDLRKKSGRPPALRIRADDYSRKIQNKLDELHGLEQEVVGTGSLTPEEKEPRGIVQASRYLRYFSEVAKGKDLTSLSDRLDVALKIARDMQAEEYGLIVFDEDTEVACDGVIFIGNVWLEAEARKVVDFPNAYFSGNLTLDQSVLEKLDLSYAEIKGKLCMAANSVGETSFVGAVFHAVANFLGQMFAGKADFDGAWFLSDAGFEQIRFLAEASFQKTNFNGFIGFYSTQFHGCVYFRETIFVGNADFRRTEFRRIAAFSDATFKGLATFIDALFKGWGDFIDASFGNEADFCGATFFEGADFDGAKFYRSAIFDLANFKNVTDEYVSFMQTEFFGSASFSETRFPSAAYFQESVFSDAVSFTKAAFRGTFECQNAKISGTAFFADTDFPAMADFQNITFMGHTNFQSARFQGVAEFGSATFEGTCSFFKSQFRSSLNVNNAHFHWRVDFQQTTFEYLPDFRYVKFDAETDLRATKIELQYETAPSDGKGTETTSIVEIIRHLKLLAINARDHRGALDRGANELRAEYAESVKEQRKSHKIIWLGRLLALLRAIPAAMSFAIASNGRSSWRPLAWLFVTTGAMALAYAKYDNAWLAGLYLLSLVGYFLGMAHGYGRLKISDEEMQQNARFGLACIAVVTLALLFDFRDRIVLSEVLQLAELIRENHLHIFALIFQGDDLSQNGMHDPSPISAANQLILHALTLLSIALLFLIVPALRNIFKIG